MRKTLLFSIVSLMLMLCGTIMAENKTVTFDATVDLSGQADAGAQSLSKEGITLSISNGMLGNGSEYRIYKNATLDITSTVGNITKIVFTDKGGNYKTDGFTSISAGSISETTWTGDAASLTLTAAGHQVRLTQLVVTIGEGGGEVNPEPQPTVETTGKGTLESPYTAADAIAVATALGSGNTSTESYYIKGKVSSIKYTFDADHPTGTFSISDDGTTESEFLIYSTYYKENEGRWAEGDMQVELGVDVVVYGQITNYNGTPETASRKSYVVSIGGISTGLNAVAKAAAEKGQLYNLSGQRVAVAKKGLYIRDGKKFLVK